MECLFALLAILLTVGAVPHDAFRHDATVSNGFVALPLRSKSATKDYLMKKSHSLSRRQNHDTDNTGDSSILWDHSLEIGLEIGSPTQPIWLPIGLSSNLLWATPLCTLIEAQPGNGNQTWANCTRVEPGLYNPYRSTTATNLSTEFTTREREAFIHVWMFEDDVWVAGLQLNDTPIGLNQIPGDDLPIGSLGLGLSMPRGRGRGSGVLGRLWSSGAIQSQSFSLSLGPSDSATSEGSEIVFGGIDTRKYEGQLNRLDMLGLWDTAFGLSYCVSLDGFFAFVVETEAWDLKDDVQTLRACFDSMSAFTHLPKVIFDRILYFFPDAQLVQEGLYTVPCGYVHLAGYVSFVFEEGATINIPYREFILEPQSSGSADEEPQCLLGITTSPSDSFMRLGETFLRSATVVFDTEDDAVYMAQYQDCGSAIGVWQSGGTGLVGECSSSDLRL